MNNSNAGDGKKNDAPNPKAGINILEVYTNAAKTHMTPYEFEITLGLGSNNYEGVRPVVNVRMSPQFAKEFAFLLNENIRIFEQKFGEIKIYRPEVN